MAANEGLDLKRQIGLMTSHQPSVTINKIDMITYFNCLVPKYKPIISEKDKQLLSDYLKQSSNFEKFDL